MVQYLPLTKSPSSIKLAFNISAIEEIFQQ